MPNDPQDFATFDLEGNIAECPEDIVALFVLFAEVERPAVKKLMLKAEPYFAGKSEHWLKRHCYMVTDTFEGIVSISMPSKNQAVQYEVTSEVTGEEIVNPEDPIS